MTPPTTPPTMGAIEGPEEEGEEREVEEGLPAVEEGVICVER